MMLKLQQMNNLKKDLKTFRFSTQYWFSYFSFAHLLTETLDRVSFLKSVFNLRWYFIKILSVLEEELDINIETKMRVKDVKISFVVFFFQKKVQD